MGFVLTQKILRSTVGLTPTEKLTLATIADRVGDSGYSFPSIRLIAGEVGVGQRTIYRTIRKLERDGLLISKGMLGKSNHYYVLEEALKSDIKCNKSGQGDDTGDTPTPDTGDTPPLTLMTLGGDMGDTLIDNITNNRIDNVEEGGVNPLAYLLPYVDVEKQVGDIAGIKIIANMNIKEGQMIMKTLDSIQSAMDGTGLKQKKKQSPKNMWVRAVSEWRVEQEIHDGMIPMTQADAGKLNTVAKKAGGGFDQILKRCVEHWVAFTVYTNKATGYAVYPDQPNINFFVKNINTAITFDPTKKSGSDIKCNNENLLD